MKSLLFLIVIALTFGCTSKNNNGHTENEIVKKTEISQVKTNGRELPENAPYIGFVQRFSFSNENEVYVELYGNENQQNVAALEKMVILTDSLIYKDDENSRHRFPASLAPKYFDLRDLSKLKIYSDSNEFVAHAEFLRVEYLTQNISSIFIAVYKTDNKIKAANYYAISNTGVALEQPKYAIVKDSFLTKNILTKLKVNRRLAELKNDDTHLRFSEQKTILSIINSDRSVYIVLTTKSEFKVLYKSSSDENLFDLKIIPLANAKFPCLLFRNVEPDTDIMWDNLLYYNGTKYEIKQRQRLVE
jgi:hypothetical protein